MIAISAASLSSTLLMSEIIPAIIPKVPDDILKRVEEVKDKAKFIHIDVLPHTFEPREFKVSMDFEVHCMFLSSMHVVDHWIDSGATRVIVHSSDFGSNKILSETLAKIKARAQAGLAIKLNSDLERIYRHIPEVDFVHLMSIAEIGEQGHPFDERIFDRIKAVKEKFPQPVISVDGGIGVDNFQRLIDVGAERLVVGHNFEAVWSQMNKSQS